MTAVDDVRALQQALISAMLKGDAQAIARYVDDDAIYIHSNGVTDSKESYLKSVKDGRFVYDALELVDERHREGADFVVFSNTLSATIRVGGATHAEPRTLIVSLLWRKLKDEWRLVLLHSTHRPPA